MHLEGSFTARGMSAAAIYFITRKELTDRLTWHGSGAGMSLTACCVTSHNLWTRKIRIGWGKWSLRCQDEEAGLDLQGDRESLQVLRR